MKERIYQDGELNIDDRDSADYSRLIDEAERRAAYQSANVERRNRLADEYEPEVEDNYDISQDL